MSICVIFIPHAYNLSRAMTGTIASKSQVSLAAKAERDVFECLAWLYDGFTPAKKSKEGANASNDTVGLGCT